MTEITWQAPEFEYREKNISWYWLSIIITSTILGFAVWQRNFLFALFILVGEILILFWAGQKPKTRSFALKEKGVEIDGKLYEFTAMDTWSLRYETDDAFAYFTLRFKQRVRPPLALLVPPNTMVAVQKALTLILTQTEAEDSLMDTLQKFFRF